MIDSGVISIRAIDENYTMYDAVETMIGISVYEAFRCQFVDANGVQCSDIVTTELGNPARWQVCDACSCEPTFKRFRVRQQVYISEKMLAAILKCRRRHLSVAAIPSPMPHGCAS